MSKEIQKDDVTLPGGLGNAYIGSKKVNITKIEKTKDSTTITLSAVVDHYLNGVPITEDAEFEIIQPKQLKA